MANLAGVGALRKSCFIAKGTSQMTHESMQAAPDILLQQWIVLAGLTSQSIKAISIRTDQSEIGFEYADGLDNLCLEPLGEGVIHLAEDFLTVFTSQGRMGETDVLTVTPEMFIQTSTKSCLEVDLEIHRQADLPGALIDDGDMIVSSSKYIGEHFLSSPIEEADMFFREPVSVTIHTTGVSPTPLEYAGSFNFADLGEQNIVLIEPYLAEEDDLDEGHLVCDIHKGHGGLRCITITRDTLTEDGPVRRIVYNDLQL